MQPRDDSRQPEQGRDLPRSSRACRVMSAPPALHAGYACDPDGHVLTDAPTWISDHVWTAYEIAALLD